MSSPFSHFLGNISSYDGNILLAAVISLLLVILFVLLLHLYAKWFLSQPRQRRRPNSSSNRPNSISHHFHTFNIDAANFPICPSKGLDTSVISTIPLFVYKSGESKIGFDCVICLSPFEENDVGRELPKCGHAFHVECIDMWLQSHSNCPICRASLVNENKVSIEIRSEESGDRIVVDSIDEESGITDPDETPTSSSFGCSLKRMLSRTRTEQNKVFPASSATTEADVLDLTV